MSAVRSPGQLLRTWALWSGAHGGTLFLDEIGELPLELQPRLLRVLESGQVRRVGGAAMRTVDVRVIAATNRDLRAEVSAGRFREDLYFRLAGAFICLPALRERLDELERLVPVLLKDLGAECAQVTAEAYDVLRSHDWPGNVRELKNTLNCALAFADGGAIDTGHVQLMRSGGGGSRPTRPPTTRGATLTSHRAHGHSPNALADAGKQSSGSSLARHRRVDALREDQEAGHQ